MDTSALSFSHPASDVLLTSSAPFESPEPAEHAWAAIPRTARRPNSPDPPSSMQPAYSAALAGVPVASRPGLPPGVTGVATAEDGDGPSTLLLVLIPLLVVVLTVLLGMIMFLVSVLFMRRRQGIRLTEDGGPLDLSRGDGVIGEGGVEGVEARWLDTCEPDVREAYRRAKDWQQSYPPNSVATDITLSQFLSIQEKGVSAWAFEPDYEDNLSLYVQSRTEITFLSDGPGMAPSEGGGNSVMANLPLPKLNEVYYWEVKVYDKPPATEVAIGLATKPYPSFRLPGWSRFSVAYHGSDGFRSHNYPFTATSYGAPLAEGDVLGVGYRPRTGTVFFTRNGRKMDDCYIGLNRFNLFPTVGANGPCTLHVNLGQAGFVFIEANVKKWGLAPSTGTLAPPPAYGSERGSILLEAGYGTPGASSTGASLLEAAARARARGSPQPVATTSPRTPRSRRSTRPAAAAAPSPLREGERSYISPTDTPAVTPRVPNPDALEYIISDDEASESDQSQLGQSASGSELEHNPPTPNLLDISLHSLRGGHYFGNRAQRERGEEDESDSEGESGGSDQTARPGQVHDSPSPPGYAFLDPARYADGLPSLPDEYINAAIAAMSDPVPARPGSQTEPPAQPRGTMGWLASLRRTS
ncbi:Protein ssh4 [Cryptotrichosporon argae]